MFTLQQLISAGLPAVDTDGNDENAATQFSRELTPAEWKTYLAIANPDLANMLQAKTDALNIPSWATWTQAEFLTWYNANISPAQVTAVANLADAKVVMAAMSVELKALGQMVIAQRMMLKQVLKMLGQ